VVSPTFASIEGFAEQLAATGLVDGEVMTADWTTATLPSWIDTIWQGVIRPQGWWQFGLTGLLKSVREVPTILLMRLTFGTGLCRFRMFQPLFALNPICNQVSKSLLPQLCRVC
jgi:MPBQ/MSBQ methyltransferase